MTSRVHSIHVAPGRRLPTKSVESVVAEGGRGLVGDRYRHLPVRYLGTISVLQRPPGTEIVPGYRR